MKSPTLAQVSIRSADPRGEIAAKLICALSGDLAHRYSDMGDDGSGHFTPQDVTVERSVFLVAWVGDRPIGCAALRPIDDETAEVKRMYVATGARRLGIGRRLLGELERFAHEFGYRLLRLETGLRQPEAVALYESFGFYPIPLFGCYREIGNPMSICYEKQVSPRQGGVFSI